jgi:hypothetical protein
MDRLAFFRPGENGFEPTGMAVSLWGEDHLHGVAVSGLLARALEGAARDAGREDLVPARYHVDLFQQARRRATTTRATVVRESPRLLLLDAVVEQDGVRVARATAAFLKPTATPGGEVWSGPDRATPPPAEVAAESDDARIPLFASALPWSDDFAAHQNGGRHATWQTGVPVVAGEDRTPFQSVASIADATSMVTNWGSAGVEFINTDISLALTRRPVSHEIGLRAVDHLASDGIAVGTAEVFDRAGALGTASVTALANARRTVDFAVQQFGGDNPGA